MSNPQVTEKIQVKQTWYTLKEACELKGVSYKTLCNKPFLQPQGSKPDGIVCGRKRWKVDTIYEWLLKTDDELNTGGANHA